MHRVSAWVFRTDEHGGLRPGERNGRSTAVNLRQEASTSSGIAKVLDKGTVIEVIERTGDWYKLNTANFGTAYISSQFFQISHVDAEVTGDGVNVREQPDAGSNTLGTLNKGTSIVVTGKSGDWYEFQYGSDYAYISSEYVEGYMLEYIGSGASAGGSSKYAVVTAKTGLNLRSDPDAGGNVLSILNYNETAEVISISGQWVKVKSSSGNTGYVSADFVEYSDQAPAADLSLGQQIIEYGRNFLGTPYSWGGTNLTKGVDCSGFVYSVMKNFGISLQRCSRDMATEGYYVAKDQLSTGDLVFFDTSGANNGVVSHVGIYIGNGDYIHSSSGKVYGVTISNLNESYSSRTYVTARRVI